MKAIVILTSILLCILPTYGNDRLEANRDIVDPELYKNATVVVRVMVKPSIGGSKYIWFKVLNHATIKSPKGVLLPVEMNVAALSMGPGLPKGFATLYLVKYNKNDAKHGWKLMEIYNPKTKSYSKGYSHHSNN